MTALSYARLTQIAEAVICERFDPAGRGGEAGNSGGESYKQGTENCAFDLCVQEQDACEVRHFVTATVAGRLQYQAMRGTNAHTAYLMQDAVVVTRQRSRAEIDEKAGFRCR